MEHWSVWVMERCCVLCRCCRAQALHYPSDRCQHQQPAQSPHLVSVSHVFIHKATVNRFLRIRLSLPSCLFSFNRIDIPPYEGYEKLYDKLLTAIEETCGFAVEWDGALHQGVFELPAVFLFSHLYSSLYCSISCCYLLFFVCFFSEKKVKRKDMSEQSLHSSEQGAQSSHLQLIKEAGIRLTFFFFLNQLDL